MAILDRIDQLATIAATDELDRLFEALRRELRARDLLTPQVDAQLTNAESFAVARRAPQIKAEALTHESGAEEDVALGMIRQAVAALTTRQ